MLDGPMRSLTDIACQYFTKTARDWLIALWQYCTMAFYRGKYTRQTAVYSIDMSTWLPWVPTDNHLPCLRYREVDQPPPSPKANFSFIHILFPKIPYTGVYPMDVEIVNKLAL